MDGELGKYGGLGSSTVALWCSTTFSKEAMKPLLLPRLHSDQFQTKSLPTGPTHRGECDDHRVALVGHLDLERDVVSAPDSCRTLDRATGRRKIDHPPLTDDVVTEKNHGAVHSDSVRISEVHTFSLRFSRSGEEAPETP